VKPETHPIYPPSRITCACGNLIETRSTRGSFSVEICSNCHPFFTGKYKLMDTAGRVEKFRKRYEGKAPASASEKVAAAAADKVLAAKEAAAKEASAKEAAAKKAAARKNEKAAEKAAEKPEAKA
jgi:large subunit ribosomal protein L31